MYFCQKLGCGATLPTPPFLLGFTAITDHLRAGEVLQSCPGVQCDANQNFNQFLVPGHVKCGAKRILSQARSFALSKCTACAALIWASS